MSTVVGHSSLYFGYIRYIRTGHFLYMLFGANRKDNKTFHICCMGFLIVFLLLFSNFSWSQADSILAFPQEQQELKLWEWYTGHKAKSYQEMRPVYDEMIRDFEKSGQLTLLKMAQSMALVCRINSLDQGQDPLQLIREAIAYAAAKKWKDVEAEYKIRLGSMLFSNEQYGLGMEWMIKGNEELDQLGWSSPFMALMGYEYMGDAFYKFGDYRSTIYFMKKADKFNAPADSKGYRYGLLNTIGLAYQKLMKYDSAIYFFNKSNEAGRIRNDSFWVALTNGNLGLVYFKSGNLDKASQLLKADYEGSIRSGIYGSAVNAGTLLANIELQRGHPEKIDEYIHFSRTYMDTTDLVGMSGFMENMMNYSRLKGDYKTALMYDDSLKTYQHRVDRKINENILAQAKMKVQVDSYIAEVKLLETQKSKQILLRNALIFILVLLSLVGILWIKRIQLKRQATVDKLTSAQKELNAYALSLFEKNQIIQSFADEIEHIKSSGDIARSDRSTHISELINQHILTDEDWRHFKQLFDVVYPGYLVRLKEKFNDLTPAETRLLALTKLQLPGKDMAGMLGISSESIRKTRYRLRKKLNLPEEGSLEELVSLI